MLFIEHNQQNYFWLNKNFTDYLQYMFIIFVPHDCHLTLFLISYCYAHHKQYGGDDLDHVIYAVFFPMHDLKQEPMGFCLKQGRFLTA